MQQFLSIVALTSALVAPQTGIVTNAPVTVSTCAISDLYPAASADLGLPTPGGIFQLSFRNTDDAVATQVTFDVAHDGTHSTVVDRGRFSKNVTIDRILEGFGLFSDDSATCAVTQIVFADGRVWRVPSRATN